MGYKWIGAILIVASCTACGFSIAAGKRKEENLMLQLLGIFQLLEAELLYRLTPLPELCQMAAVESRGILKNVFLNLNRELCRQKLPDAGSCMAAAIGKCGDLPNRIRSILSQLGYSLGRYDLEGQLQGIRTVRRRTEESLESLRKNRDERLRSYQTLGICAGLALAIILI